MINQSNKKSYYLLKPKSDLSTHVEKVSVICVEFIDKNLMIVNHSKKLKRKMFRINLSMRKKVKHKRMMYEHKYIRIYKFTFYESPLFVRHLFVLARHQVSCPSL